MVKQWLVLSLQLLWKSKIIPKIKVYFLKWQALELSIRAAVLALPGIQHHWAFTQPVSLSIN